MTDTGTDLYDWLDARGELSSELIERIEIDATDHAVDAASWASFDADLARHCIELDEDGDPRFEEKWPTPNVFSGEWADGLTIERVLDALEIDEAEVSEWYRDKIESAYEEAFSEAYHTALLSRAAMNL